MRLLVLLSFLLLFRLTNRAIVVSFVLRLAHSACTAPATSADLSGSRNQRFCLIIAKLSGRNERG